MSEQYQRFKQNFFKQHPPSSATTQSKSNQQSISKTFKQYDPYSEYTGNQGHHNYQMGHGYENELRIQNETHFPFDQMDQTTFQDLGGDDPFLMYKMKEKEREREREMVEGNAARQIQGKSYQIQGKGYQGNSKNYATISNGSSRHEQYEEDYRKYVNDLVSRQLPTKTQSHLEYPTVTKHQESTSKRQFSPNENYLRPQLHTNNKTSNVQILDHLKIPKHQSTQQTFHHPQQHNEFQQRSPNHNSFIGQYGYDINKQYIVGNNRTNNLLPISPSKQLPVIFNRPNSNSQHKLNQQTFSASNSRVIIQAQPTHQHQKSVHFPPVSTQVHPVVVNPPAIQTFGQIPQIPQSLTAINSGSRVVVQSEVVQNKSIHNIPPPPSYNVVHQQPVIVNSPPNQIHFENRGSQQGMISIKQYEKLKGECAMWQQKYYQVNDQLTRLQSERSRDSYGGGFSQQTLLIREQNARLMERIRMLQNSDKNSYEKIKTSYEELMKRYQSSLMKEANLLIDRFKLEMKHNERY